MESIRFFSSKSKVAISITIVVVLSILLTANLSAAPVFGKEFQTPVGDGTTITTKVWGDEFYRIVESIDGYTLYRDPDTKMVYYAKLSADGSELESTGVLASEPAPEGLEKHLKISKESAIKKVTAARNEMFKDIKASLRVINGVPQPYNTQTDGSEKE